MNRSQDKPRRGQVIVLAPVMLAVLGAILSMTADVGHMAVWRARLQNAADASSFAAAHVLLEQRTAGAPEDLCRYAAETEANAICALNADEAGLAVEFGTWDESGNFMPVDSTTPATAVRTRAYREGDAPGGALALFFGSMVGLGRVEVAGAAVCEISSQVSSSHTGLSPFAVPAHQVTAIGEELTFYPADGDEYDGVEDHTVGPGCFGLLNLDGGSLGTTELWDWIVNGYDAEIAVDPEEGYVWIDGCTGFRSALELALEQKLGQPMLVMVYDEIVGVGATADFRCIGFVRLTLIDFDLSAEDPYIRGRVETVQDLYDLKAGQGLSSINVRKIQLVG